MVIGNLIGNNVSNVWKHSGISMKRTCLLFFCAAFSLIGLSTAAESGIKVGDTVTHVLDSIGPPSGKAQMGSREIYIYEAGNVVFRNGKVVEVPPSFRAPDLGRF